MASISHQQPVLPPIKNFVGDRSGPRSLDNLIKGRLPSDDGVPSAVPCRPFATLNKRVLSQVDAPGNEQVNWVMRRFAVSRGSPRREINPANFLKQQSRAIGQKKYRGANRFKENPGRETWTVVSSRRGG